MSTTTRQDRQFFCWDTQVVDIPWNDKDKFLKCLRDRFEIWYIEPIDAVRINDTGHYAFVVDAVNNLLIRDFVKHMYVELSVRNVEAFLVDSLGTQMVGRTAVTGCERSPTAVRPQHKATLGCREYTEKAVFNIKGSGKIGFTGIDRCMLIKEDGYVWYNPYYIFDALKFSIDAMLKDVAKDEAFLERTVKRCKEIYSTT